MSTQGAGALMTHLWLVHFFAWVIVLACTLQARIALLNSSQVNPLKIFLMVCTIGLPHNLHSCPCLCRGTWWFGTAGTWLLPQGSCIQRHHLSCCCHRRHGSASQVSSGTQHLKFHAHSARTWGFYVSPSGGWAMCLHWYVLSKACQFSVPLSGGQGSPSSYLSCRSPDRGGPSSGFLLTCWGLCSAYALAGKSLFLPPATPHS